MWHLNQKEGTWGRGRRRTPGTGSPSCCRCRSSDEYCRSPPLTSGPEACSGSSSAPHCQLSHLSPHLQFQPLQRWTQKPSCETEQEPTILFRLLDRISYSTIWKYVSYNLSSTVFISQNIQFKMICCNNPLNNLNQTGSSVELSHKVGYDPTHYHIGRRHPWCSWGPPWSEGDPWWCCSLTWRSSSSTWSSPWAPRPPSCQDPSPLSCTWW